MNREQMIEALTLEAVQYIYEAALRGDTGLLVDYLQFGFVGFDNMSDSDLLLEYETTIGDTQEVA
jgi:hypothetical protein